MSHTNGIGGLQIWRRAKENGRTIRHPLAGGCVIGRGRVCQRDGRDGQQSERQGQIETPLHEIRIAQQVPKEKFFSNHPNRQSKKRKSRRSRRGNEADSLRFPALPARYLGGYSLLNSNRCFDPRVWIIIEQFEILVIERVNVFDVRVEPESGQ